MSVKNLSHIININDKQDIIDKLVPLCKLNDNSTDKISTICNQIKFPLTIILEDYYIDKVYRDTFFLYFSQKHFNCEKHCKRLTFFKSSFTQDDFYDKTSSDFDFLQKNIVGTMVIKPLEIGQIGRTLLDPKHLNLSNTYIRTTDFVVEVLGNLFVINAFPFSEQDSETMTCAETTIWGIMEYYGTRYPEYKTVLPNEITKNVDSNCEQRVLPSTGLNYETVSKALKSFGFQPKLYALQSYNIKSPVNMYQNIFHYYVESGIPIGVGTILPKENCGHSTICIGHAEANYTITPSQLYVAKNLTYTNSCNFYNRYVIIDDNQIPYTIEDFNDFTLYDNAFVSTFVVPLHKRICMDADLAQTIMQSLLYIFDDIISQVINSANIGYNSISNPLVTRLFLTTSRKFKTMRTKKSNSLDEKIFYSNILYPKFLWVVELSTFDLYKNKKIIGELTLDATSPNKFNPINNLISIRLCSYIGYRLPNETFQDLVNKLSIANNNICNIYDIYINNLK
ncbi:MULTISPECIES: hypothetical protein [Clostridium]|uniref:hypothetical protein n=1 Tax=Clostridium TaxID=1485 RepID=UPI0029005433|nr:MULTISPECIES: hypothetical protein [Clostridium]MDU1229910.1 hypothetical protein [Clostridium sp.]